MALRLPKTRGMLRSEAATWLVRLQSARDPMVKQKFERWYNRDQRHADTFERVKRSYEQAGLLRHSPAQPREPSAASEASKPPPRYAIAAAIAAAALLPLGYVLLAGMAGRSEAAVLTLATRDGEIRRVRLVDGSRVTLDTNSRLEVQVNRSHREAVLRSGRVRVDVARRADPFIVRNGGATVTIGDGVVDAVARAGASLVEIVAGTAKAGGTGPDGDRTIELAAGEQIVAGKAGLAVQRTPPHPDWMTGMLTFDGTPLDQAVALANRGASTKIVVASDLSRLKVTGAFKPGDSEALAEALAAAFDLNVSRRPGALILSSKRRGPPPKKNGG